MNAPKKYKVLFVIGQLTGGGAERVLETILNNLDYNIFDVTVYTVQEVAIPASYPAQITYRYIFGAHSFLGKGIVGRLCNKVVNKIKIFIYHHFSAQWFYRLNVKGRYDVEVAFIEGYATRIVSGSTNRMSKKLAWVHIDLLNNHWTQVAFKDLAEEHDCYKVFDKIACVSKTVENAMHRLFPDLTSLTTVYNPINEVEIIRKSREYVVDKKKDATNIVTIGRLDPQKGYDRLLPIMNELKNENVKFDLSILGTGNEYDKLKKYIEANNLGDCVHLLGFVSNPYPFLAAADLFVCSSRAEGYSTVVTEALILGVPVVTTNCSGMMELLGEHGEYGMIVENNSKCLKEALAEVLTSKDKLSELKKKALARSHDFSIARLMSPVEKMLKSHNINDK